jgi:hypothetical protein
MKGITFILLKASTTATPGGMARRGVYASVGRMECGVENGGTYEARIRLPTLTSYWTWPSQARY